MSEHSTGHTRQRDRILELVRERDEPVDASALAARTGLHTTSVRFHLDALCDEGILERIRLARPGVGRPRIGYRAVAERFDYRRLAATLALELGDTSGERHRHAEAIGRRWAQGITPEPAPEKSTASSARDAANPVEDAAAQSRVLAGHAAEVAKAFARMGFAPEPLPTTAAPADTEQTIRLRGCPIRDFARDYPEVGCAMHNGLLQGLLGVPAARGNGIASNVTAELQPFVEPQLCLVRMTLND
ncbi:helix-turn-helix transcriptional regulator [Mycobacterium sp.]|uniref:helix-turn-helix transcriptional regulator n=1 Tax=Mycobacterium sp. TaxID=1785 RepID=UPI003A855E33